MSPLDRLASAHSATGDLIHAVPDEAWTLPTPCDEWDVADLVRHLWTGESIFAALVRDGRADRPALFAAAAALGPADLPAAYDTAGAALREVLAQPGAMDGAYELPIGVLPAVPFVDLRTTETLTHGWDLARATERRLVVDDDLVEHAIAASRALLPEVPAGRPVFGTPQPVADDAPALDRLAALLGRTTGDGQVRWASTSS